LQEAVADSEGVLPARDDVGKESETYQQVKERQEELKQEKSRLLDELANFTNMMDYAELLEGKLENPGLAKKGKEGVACGVPKGKENEPCQNPGHLTNGLLCGTHKSRANSPAFLAVFDILTGNTFSSKIASVASNPALRREKVGVLKTLHLSTHNKQLLTKGTLEKTVKELEKVTEEEKAQRQVIRQMRGARVTKLHDLLEVTIGVRPTHRRGDFGMVGNDCRKVLKNIQVFLAVIQDKPQLHEKYTALFERLQFVVDMLYRISPLSVLTNLPGEFSILTDSESSDSDLNSDPDSGIREVDFVSLAFQELQSFTVKNFTFNPIPKQHILASHGPPFLGRWLSLGMFSEQAVESVHAIFNRLRKKYKNMGAEGAEHKALERVNAVYAADPKGFKVKGRIGKRRKRAGCRLKGRN
jgi:hypothetical protein